MTQVFQPPDIEHRPNISTMLQNLHFSDTNVRRKLNSLCHHYYCCFCIFLIKYIKTYICWKQRIVKTSKTSIYKGSAHKLVCKIVGHSYHLCYNVMTRVNLTGHNVVSVHNYFNLDHLI